MTGFDQTEINRSAHSAETALDTSLAMQTPEGIEYMLYPAGIVIRSCAWGIDCLLTGVALFGFMILNSITAGITGTWFFSIIGFILNWFYFVIFELVWNGQTPGKRIMGIRVTGSDGSPVTAKASFLRNLLRFADSFFGLYLIGFICMIFSPGFRRIGDWAGDTLVIYTSRTRLPARYPVNLRNTGVIPWLSGFPVQVPEKKLRFEEKQAILMFARRYPLLGVKRADEIADPWVSYLRSGSGGDNRVISGSRYILGMAHFISGAS